MKRDEKEALAQVNAQLYERPGIVNARASGNNIRADEEKSIPQEKRPRRAAETDTDRAGTSRPVSDGQVGRTWRCNSLVS